MKNISSGRFTPPQPLKTAVLFLIFNRLDTTKRVFESIRQARPPRLYVAADGHRDSRPGEDVKIMAVRDYVMRHIDWDCEVKTLFREKNLGCKYAVSSAIDWFFDNEEMGIIIEDDCLPHSDFFYFCETLLHRYRLDNRVSVITGNNFQNGQHRGDASYYFSKYNHCWGWASWQRAWSYYQGALPFWSEWSQSKKWTNINPDHVERKYWNKIFNQVVMGKVNSWAYPWTACVWKNNGLTATPNVNLVSNIGFGEEATHTSASNSTLAHIPVKPLGEMTHPDDVVQDLLADKYAFDHAFGGRYLRFPQNIIRLPRRIAGALYRSIRWMLA
jgi:hypothetical protein